MNDQGRAVFEIDVHRTDPAARILWNVGGAIGRGGSEQVGCRSKVRRDVGDDQVGMAMADANLHPIDVKLTRIVAGEETDRAANLSIGRKGEGTSEIAGFDRRIDRGIPFGKP